MNQLLIPTIIAFTVTACASTPKTEPEEISFPHNGSVVWADTMPTKLSRPQSASLWTTSPNALLSMRRAKQIGDLLTVLVEVNDQASLNSSLSRTQDSNENLSINALLGLPQLADSLLPGGATLAPSVDFSRKSGVNGNGAVNRAEKITFTLAARVIGVEPNGNLIIEGFQQTRVSNEIRYLSVSGVIRAQDITRNNTVTYEKIADAKLSYLSDGEANAAIERGKIPKLLDWLLPF